MCRLPAWSALTGQLRCFRYDEGNDGFLDLEELKKMMEKLGAPQTHIGLKEMIRDASEDESVNKISFRAVSA